MKIIGPNFFNELSDHGGLVGQHFAVHFQSGEVEFFDDTPQEVVDGVNLVLAAHDPATPDVVALRAQRDALLAASDWSQMPDVPEATRAAYAPYRVALRNLPEDPSWPNVQFPAKPA